MAKAEVVVITGASAGIGRALARRFARDGASIALLARGKTGLEAAVREVEELGGRALAIEIDVADRDAVEDAATKIEQELGPIDIWINNAAAMIFGRAEKLSAEELRRVSDVTYHGAVWGSMAALARMRTRGRGTIVQVGSGAAIRALPMMSAYSAAKQALRGFSDSLRVELRHDGIDVRVIMVHPSAINTPLYSWARNLMPRRAKPIAPVYQPEVAAEVIHWAAHARRRELLLGWSTVGVGILNTISPGLVDRLLARYAFGWQQTDEPMPADARHNLFKPLDADEDFGAHGVFGEHAHSPARLVQLVARMGAGGIRAMIGLKAVMLAAILD